MLASLMQDLRYAIRQLRRTPGFTVTAVVTLALGIGANGAIFTFIHGMLLKDLPVADPATLVRLGDNTDCCVNVGTRDDGDYSLFSLDTYQKMRRSLPEFEELAAMQAGFSFRPITARRDGHGNLARSMNGEFVSGNYFRTFGLAPHAGRLFNDSDDAEGSPIVAVLSYDAWKNNYASGPSVVGSTFWINTQPVTIAGIAPEGYFGDRISPSQPDFYLPIGSMTRLTGAPYLHNAKVNWLYMIGRVKPGTAIGPLQTKVSGTLRSIFASIWGLPSVYEKSILSRAHIALTPGGAGIRNLHDEDAQELWLLMGISGTVLLIACANIANLLLVRGMGRAGEMSLRSALGAHRTRILRQLLTESLLLAGISGVAGVGVACLGARALLSMASSRDGSLPVSANPSPEVLAFALGLTLLTGILFGLAPAWVSSKSDPIEALRSGTRATTGGATLLQRGLVVGQAALSLILLVTAGLFTQSLNKLQHVDLKLDTTNRYIVHINPQGAGYSQPRLEALYQSIEQRFHMLPGVQRVGIASYTPMEDNNVSVSVQVQGKPETGDSASPIRINSEYFDSVGTRVVRGRGFRGNDTSISQRVAVINETAARKLFAPGENPIGHHIGSSGPVSSGDFEIVGIVEDTVYTSVRMKNHLVFFIPGVQRGASAKGPIEQDDSLYAGAIVIAADQPIADIEAKTRQTLASINPNLTVVKFETFSDQVADRFHGDRLLAKLTGLFSAVALMLATIGLYGVTAYGVARRTSEIGIRIALGAERRRVVAMVLRGTLLQTGLGLLIGLPIALLGARIMKSQLYEINGVNALVLSAAVSMLALAAAIAGFLPARHAAYIDPQEALRHE
ncbi:ABC transporter permease [Silvibacterium acidisoli]|uniref:ABC transporter permease n=1 Tax=Acidobacteriaceae bacterium ZG23-2 TaxID=2883246 RepID=UPI00406C37C8